MSQSPNPSPLSVDYQPRRPSTAGDPGFWWRFVIGLFLGPSVLLIIMAGWGLATLSASDHYLGQTPVAVSITIHGTAVLSIISAVFAPLRLLRRRTYRPWVWGGMVGLGSIIVFIVMTAIRTLF